MKNNKILNGFKFFGLSFLAFLGLGLEALLVFLIEPNIYGKDISQWTDAQSILHWIFTIILWGIVFFILTKISKKRLGFNLFQKPKSMKIWQIVIIIVCVIFMLIVSYIDWDGFKVVKEYLANGIAKFIFQYIYYIVETALFLLIIIFGQKACEEWFNFKNIPYGGIIVALTWGISHTLTKGNLLIGLLSALAGVIFGLTYLLTNKNTVKTYCFVLIMFLF